MASSFSIASHRKHFPYIDDSAYFNYGGQGPMPTGALQALDQAQHQLQKIGPFSGAANRAMNAETDQLRQLMAAELGAEPGTIALTENVSLGCNIALWGLDWQRGDHLLISDCEHQGIVGAVQALQQRTGIEVSILPLLDAPGDPVARLTAHLRPTTRLVVLSHILWNTGQVLPLAAMVAAARAQVASVLFLVDAAQSVGVLPLDLNSLGADFYAFTGHKWWCGPAGVGGLYVRPAARSALRPTFIGWRSVTVDGQGMPIGHPADSRQYEIASTAVALFPGLRAAIALHREFGSAAQRYGLICQRSAELWQRLRALPDLTCVSDRPPAAGLVAFQLASGRHQALVEQLEAQGILARVILNPHCVRVCVHYFTTTTEIDRLVAAIAAF
jgi:L-cysteine/cystine lyase